MTMEVPFAKRLLARLGDVANRDEQVLANNKEVAVRIKKAMPIIDQTLGGKEASMIAIREVVGLLKVAYDVIESDAEALSQTKAELNEARDVIEISNKLLEQGGHDLANIRTFSNDEIWLGDHLETIKRVVDIVNLQKLEVALDEVDKDRFEDFAHAVQRSGQKRQDRKAEPE